MINRKDDHVKLAKLLYSDRKVSDFDNLKFVYNSLAEMHVNEVDISTSFSEFKMEVPFFINAMTGGSEKTKIINKQLAEISKETGVAMASGSLSAAIKNEDVSDSFKIIRSVNKDGLIFANIGAEASVNKALKAIEILDADALQIHLNVIQELVMPEGDRDFTNWISNIENIIKAVKVPVIIKEVGFGMSRKTIKQLKAAGAVNIDVSGSGGTNFASIENYRRKTTDYQYLENLGQSTVISLLEAQDYIDNTNIIASGGIRNPLDIIKSLALGAKAVGISALILNELLENGVEATINKINSYKNELKVIMTILGVKNLKELRNVDIIIKSDVKDWCLARNIDYKYFSNRSV